MKNLILLLEANNNDQALIIVAYIVGIIILIFITRAIFSIGTIVRNLKAQTKLLGHIADKVGVDIDLVKKEVFASKDEEYDPSTKLVKERPEDFPLTKKTV